MKLYIKEVKRCADCPDFSTFSYDHFWCNRKEKYLELDPYKEIHPDCPLEDVIKKSCDTCKWEDDHTERKCHSCGESKEYGNWERKEG